jgi:hypothetical protein
MPEPVAIHRGFAVCRRNPSMTRAAGEDKLVFAANEATGSILTIGTAGATGAPAITSVPRIIGAAGSGFSSRTTPCVLLLWRARFKKNNR